MFLWFKDSVPQFLYKYVTRDRLDILENGLIRFTQLCDFNDPFEGVGINEITKVKTRHEYVEEISRAAGFMGGWRPDQLRDADYERRQQDLKRQSYIDECVPSLGVLSLSAIPDNPAMWAHYAENHGGLVIQFDTSSSFFSSTYAPRRWPRHHYRLFQLRRVRYQRNPPDLSSSKPEKSLERIVFTKGMNWSYEQEWRLCRSLEEAERNIENLPFSISLFSVLPSAIRAVFFGRNMPNADIERCLSCIRADNRYGHTKYYRAVFEEGAYVVHFKKLSSV